MNNLSQPIRQLQIPNLNGIDIVEDVIIENCKKVIITYEFNRTMMLLLELEVMHNVNIKDEIPHWHGSSPLECIKDTFEAKIIDAIENQKFKLIANSIKFFGTECQLEFTLQIL